MFNVHCPLTHHTLLQETTKQETREAILNAAERLLTRYGYGKMTMSHLAEEAGIGVGTSYLHFPGKAEVALAVVTRANMRVVEEQRKIAASSESSEDRLREILTQRVLIRFERLRQQKHPLAELKIAIERQTGLAEQGLRWREQETQIVADLLREGKEHGEFRVDNAAATADAMLWALEAFLPRNLRPEDLERPQIMLERVHRVVALLLCAVSRREQTA